MSTTGLIFSTIALGVIIHTLYSYSRDMVNSMVVPGNRSTTKVLFNVILWILATTVYVTLAGVIISAMTNGQ